MESLTVILKLKCTECDQDDALTLLPLIAESSDGPTMIGHCDRCDVNIGWDMHTIQLDYWREVGQPPINPNTN